jgi:hypothetical protein
MGITEIQPGTLANPTTINNNFAYINKTVPLGTILPWLKDYTNTPILNNRWVECNGQTLSDSDSVFDGQIIPDLNGAVGSGLKGRFLRGHTESGLTESSQNLAHTHTMSGDTYGPSGGAHNIDFSERSNETSTATNTSGGTEARPNNYSVVYIMRVK